MKKIDENNETVSYVFDMLAIDKEHFKGDERYPYKVDSHIAYGYCTFNKKTKEFILDKEKTDPYFFNDKRAVDCVNMKLLRILRTEDAFPETTCYAS